MDQPPASRDGDGPRKAAGAKPIGMACRACRLRKIRCGGERPRCSYCVKKGYECLLTPHKKRGRPRKDEQRSRAGYRPGPSGLPPLQSYSGLGAPPTAMPAGGSQMDIHQMWHELTGLSGLALPPELSALAAGSATQAQDTSQGSFPNIAPAFSLGAADWHQLVAPMAMPDASDALLFGSNYAFPRYDPREVAALAEAAAASMAAQGPPLELGVQPVPQSATHAPQQSPLSAPQSLTGDGILGLTAQQPSGPHRGPTSDSEASRALSVPVSQTVDEGIRAYFEYVQPWFPILHRPTFERQVVEGRVDRMLYYAVQAIAARFRTTGDATQKKGSKRPYKRGRRYARAARALLPDSLRDAQLSTLQAITILALYMSVSGHWQEGAALENLAVQLAFIGQYNVLDEEFLLPPVANNMGMYETGWSEHSQPARLEVLSRPGGILDHEQRRRVWWSIFQLERFNGLAMGRPPIIKPGWHWVWLPCSEELWATENPAGPLAWEMGLADPGRQRPTESVSNSRVDLVLALIMGQLVEQRTEMFRLFFPRVDRGTLFYDNLPTHSMGWSQRLEKLRAMVGALEHRIRQWHAELDRYADKISARRHANFEIMGASFQIHLYACVLQIREHLFEDLLVDSEAKRQTTATESGHSSYDGDGGMSDHSHGSSEDLSLLMEKDAVDKSTCRRGYMARAKRPELTLLFVSELDDLAQRCWDRSIAMADEVSRLLRLHWLRPFDAERPAASDKPLSVFDEQVVVSPAGDSAATAASDSWTLGGRPPHMRQRSSTASAAAPSATAALDPRIADRFKLMNPQTPYYLFVAGKVQAARLKQVVTAEARQRDKTVDCNMDVDADDPVADAIRRTDDIWSSHGLDGDAAAVEAKLDDIIAALESCQLFWYSLNFASHLKYLRGEAAKPLLRSVYRE
ncbi:hypothetical protein IWQ56_000595 [Coemansia nantahalensis]|nr:hypothetical protein IWQ56_000595 [Coemansia nantahalensis]